MKIILLALSSVFVLLTANANAAVQTDFESIKFILSSQNVIDKIKPNQKLQAIVRKGESFDIRLINSEGSCEQYNTMVVSGLSKSGVYFQQTEIDDQPRACN